MIGQIFVAINNVSVILVIVTVRARTTKTPASPRAKFLPPTPQRKSPASSSPVRSLI